MTKEKDPYIGQLVLFVNGSGSAELGHVENKLNERIGDSYTYYRICWNNGSSGFYSTKEIELYMLALCKYMGQAG